MSLSGATIAFDLDGTLVDTAPDLVGSLNGVLAERGLAALPAEAAIKLVGRGARSLIVRAFEASDAPLTEAEVDAQVARYIEIYRTRLADESRPFPGVEAALDRLAGDGARLVVCTNKRTDLSVALLEALWMADRFDAVIGADAAPAAKPDPRHFLAAVAAAGGDRSRALMVGDSINDVMSARGAGAPVVVVGFGYTDIAPKDLGADALIEHFSDLPIVARRLLAI